MIFAKKLLPFFIILFLEFFTFKSLLSAGFFPIHDNTQVTRVSEMAKALNDGMFPVRWSMDLGFGFGYPVFNYYAPLPYYIGGVINLLGANALDATKLMMLLGVILSGFSMYMFSRQFFGKWGGVFSALLYAYAPYHGVNIYIRGDVSEFFAYGFMPLLFYGLYKIYQTNKSIYIYATSIFYALIVISHNLTALMISPFALFFAVYLGLKNKKNIHKLFIPFVLGICISAFYWLPVFLEMKYTNVLSQIGGGSDFRDHFVCIEQLWASPWGYGGSAKGCIDGISFMIGKMHILLAISVIVGVFYYIVTKKISNFSLKDKENIFMVILFSVFSLLSIFLLLEISKPVWEAIKPFEFLQFPWRFLNITTFSLSFISGAAVWIMEKIVKNKYYYYLISTVLILLVVFLNAKFFIPQDVFNATSKDFTNKEIVNWEISKISTEYMPKNFSKPEFSLDVADFSKINNSKVKVSSFMQKTQRISIGLIAAENTSIVIPLAYFPAWKASLDNKEIPIYENRHGSLVNIPTGNHLLVVNYFQTPIERLADLISLAGIIGVFLGILISVKKYDKN